MNMHRWLTELKLKGFSGCRQNWSSIDAIHKVFSHKTTDIRGIYDAVT